MLNNTLCCGLLVADLKFELEKFPSQDEKVFANSFTVIPGGPATNAALTIKQLGGKATLISTTGTCALSDSLIDTLNNQGIETPIIQKEDGLNCSAICVEANGERRGISYKKTFSYSLPDSIPEPDVILVDGHQKEASLALLNKFPKAISILDAGSVHEGTEALFERVNWLITSKKYALSKTRQNDLNSALKALSKLNDKVVITDGENGCLYSVEGSIGKIDGKKVNCIDSNGAGDVFHGAFATSINRLGSFEKSLEFANTVAAQSCEHKGIIGAVKNSALY